MKRGSSTWAITTAVVIVLARAGLAQSPTQSPTADVTASLVSRVWWNQPAIADKLHLAADQRGKMDALLTQAIERQRTAAVAVRKQRQDYEAALKSGDWDAAARAVAQLPAATGPIQTGQMTLKIDVLKLFTAEQRTTLMKDFPHLLRQPWMRGMGGGNGPGRGGRKRGGAAAPAVAPPPN